jgi:hypothetical protein
MLIDQKQVLFLLGIEGVGIRGVSVTWKSSNLPKLMCAFIYRLYKPAHFADPSYLSVKPDVPKKSVKYSVRITLSQTNTIVCRGFFPLFAANPFGTRTHVLTNPSSNVEVNGQVLTVLKHLYTLQGQKDVLTAFGIHEASHTRMDPSLSSPWTCNHLPVTLVEILLSLATYFIHEPHG